MPQAPQPPLHLPQPSSGPTGRGLGPKRPPGAPGETRVLPRAAGPAAPQAGNASPPRAGVRPASARMAALLLQLTQREERLRDGAVAALVHRIPGWVTPDGLSQLRLGFVAAAALSAALGAELRVVLVLFGAAVLTDFLDGPLARWRGATSDRGARLDQVADAVTGGSLGLLAVAQGVVDRELVLAMVIPQAAQAAVAAWRRVPVGGRTTTVGRLQFVLMLAGFGVGLWGVSAASPSLVRLGRGLLYAEAAVGAVVAVLRGLGVYPEPPEGP